MSTRAGIKIIDDTGAALHFYRHSDGYPEGTMPTLERFLNLVKQGRIRNNVLQAAGWLVLIGHDEYLGEDGGLTLKQIESSMLTRRSYCDWKVGAYEPTTNIDDHGDLEYKYTIDLDKLTIEVKGI